MQVMLIVIGNKIGNIIKKTTQVLNLQPNP